ncbi:MAG: glucosaminidase domain-containing protein [Flavobacteriales bacterium]|nr:glucosaminidase domain-containing protein [Flavobacteriales bacterium]
MSKRIIKAFIFIFIPSLFYAQQANNSRADYIKKYADAAVNQMLKHQIPASITLAQGILESGNGNSHLSVKGKNHFGIKCHKDWGGKKIFLDDDKKNECFRSYKSVSESYEDHSLFLTKYSRYKFLFDLKITDYKGWAKGLKKAGYATNPKYPELLIKIIEENELYSYDKETKHKNINEVKTNEKQTILIHDNNIKYIISLPDESLLDIAKKLDMGLWQLYKYNDISKNNEIDKENQVVFLQPKRNKAKIKYHTVLDDETLWGISQLYGIKLKKLKAKNKTLLSKEIKSGDKLTLR